jgi:hypothetical protein
MRRQYLVALILTLSFSVLVAESSPGSIIMYNGRPGARLVMHLYPGEDGFVRTSTLGQPYPGAAAKRQLIIADQPDGRQATLVPLSSDHRLPIDPVASQDWGLGTNGFTTRSGLSFRVRSPYRRFENFGDDFVSKATTAPLFILDVTIKNSAATPMSGRLLIGMDNSLGKYTRGNSTGVILKDLTDGLQPAGGSLALMGDSSDLRAVTSPDLLADFAGLPSRKSANLEGGLIWRYKIPAKSSLTRHFIFAGYTDKTMMHDCFTPARFTLNYTRWWKSATDVASWGVDNLPKLVAMSDRLENESGIRKLDEDHRFVISQGVAEHLSDTHLLRGTNGRLIWMYSEAGFSAGYLSTVDLIPDTFLLNKQYFPWTLKLLVDLHSRYVVQDGLGAYVTHDVGATDLEPRGNYGESGAGHRMPVEEICNYIHLLWLTWGETSDKSFLVDHSSEMIQLLNSLIARDADNDGITDSQSNMAESDTFDNGALIGNTKKSTYLGLKVWTSARFLAVMLSEANKASSAARAADLADRAEKTLITSEKQHGYFWTILDPAVPNHDASCLWVTKGMLTPYIGGFDFGAHRAIEEACAQHVRTVAPTLRRSFGYSFDSVPTSRVTWQSQSLMVDLIARNYWGGQDLGVAGMMARSGRASGVLNEFVGPNSGLAKDTEWPSEQVYSRMASAIGWLPGVMPKPVRRTPIRIRWSCGSSSANGSIFKEQTSPQSQVIVWKTRVLPVGKYYVKIIGRENDLLSKSVIATANGVKLAPGQSTIGAPRSDCNTMTAAVVTLRKSSSMLIRLKGASASSVSFIEVSNEPTAVRVQQEHPEKLSVELSSPRLRADGKDSLTVTVKLCDSEGTALKLSGVPVSISIKGSDAKIDGESSMPTANGSVQFKVSSGIKTENASICVSSGTLPAVEKQIAVGGEVMYLVDVGREGGAVMDSSNRLWLGDGRYDPSVGYGAIDDGGDSVTSDAPISGTQDPKLYQTYRWSRTGLAYRFDTYEPGEYLVRLLFTETFFGTNAAPGPGIGRRIIDVAINDKQALSGFDIFKAAGGANTAVDRSFVIHIDRADPIIVRLTTTADCASLAGIEVRPYKGGITSATTLP